VIRGFVNAGWREVGMLYSLRPVLRDPGRWVTARDRLAHAVWKNHVVPSGDCVDIFGIAASRLPHQLVERTGTTLRAWILCGTRRCETMPVDLDTISVPLTPGWRALPVGGEGPLAPKGRLSRRRLASGFQLRFTG
jgi:hypothetical protein